MLIPRAKDAKNGAVFNFELEGKRFPCIYVLDSLGQVAGWRQEYLVSCLCWVCPRSRLCIIHYAPFSALRSAIIMAEGQRLWLVVTNVRLLQRLLVRCGAQVICVCVCVHVEGWLMALSITGDHVLSRCVLCRQNEGIWGALVHVHLINSNWWIFQIWQAWKLINFKLSGPNNYLLRLLLKKLFFSWVKGWIKPSLEVQIYNFTIYLAIRDGVW